MKTKKKITKKISNIKNIKNKNNIEISEIEQENENEPMNLSVNKSQNRLKQNNIKIKNNYFIKKFLYILFPIIIILLVFYIFTYFKTTKSIEIINAEYMEKLKEFNFQKKNEPMHINEDELEKKKMDENKILNKKVGVAFVFKSIFGNGIGRMLSLICSELAKIEKYDIYLITGKGTSYDFPFDEKVKMIRIIENKTKIEEFDKTSNIKIYVLHNDLTPSSIKWYQSLNGGKKVIGVMHGVYMSSIYSNQTGVYSIWKNNQYYDAYIQVIADDYYVNKRLGINNCFFIPNLYTFDPTTTPSSNLTYKNLMIMGRELDKIKGGLYGIKAMDLIRREVPDAKLYFISSNYKIDFLQNLIKELNLTDNIEVLHYTTNISQYFLNSSILLYPSLSEASPLVMNEGKAHGLPIVAFNVTYSPPYQKGVILVDIMNYTQMAKESIKLLKDYNYRKIKGLESKISLNFFSNKETVDKWDKLFQVLIKNDSIEYRKLQNYTFEKYYNEEEARSHLETSWNMGKIYNKAFWCHDFNNMLNLTYINKIQNCKNDTL